MLSKEVIYFRTRGGPAQGWGNVFRLASFADFCREKGHNNIRFFVQGPKEVILYLEGKGFDVIKLAEEISLDEESDIISGYEPPDILIMEMLDCHYYRQSMLKKHVRRKLVVFDDLLDHVYCADLVVCGQNLPNYGNKEISDSTTRFLIGFEYFLCRPEFLRYCNQEKCLSTSIDNVLVTLGGGMYDVGYLKVAHALASFEKEVIPTFILGYASQERIKKEIKRILPHAKVYGGVKNFEEMLWQSDLAIVSGGYTKLEAAITSTPAIIISVQWHQIPISEEFSKITKMPYSGYMSFVSLENIRKEIKDFFPLSKRVDACKNARDIIDGKGFERVFSSIFY